MNEKWLELEKGIELHLKGVLKQYDPQQIRDRFNFLMEGCTSLVLRKKLKVKQVQTLCEIYGIDFKELTPLEMCMKLSVTINVENEVLK